MDRKQMVGAIFHNSIIWRRTNPVLGEKFLNRFLANAGPLDDEQGSMKASPPPIPGRT
jgi:hypothetical protein